MRSMAVVDIKCGSCCRGYLVEEYSFTGEGPYYFCNNCFKYSEPKTIAASVCDIGAGFLSDLTEEEIDKLLNNLFP